MPVPSQQLPSTVLLENDPRRALAATLPIYEEALRNKDAVRIFDSLLIIGTCQMELDGYTIALKTLLEARRYAAECPEHPAHAELHNILGNCYLGLGELGLAQESYVTALTLAESLHDTTQMCTVGMDLVVCCVQLGQYREAIVHLLAILALPNVRMEGRYAITARLRIGYLYASLRDYHRALTHRRVALERMNTESSTLVRMLVTISVAFAYLDGREPQEALPLFHANLESARRLGLRRHEAIALQGIGRTLYESGDAVEAQSYLEQAFSLHSSLDYLLGQVYCEAYLGMVNAKLGAVASAISHLQSAISKARSHSMDGVIGPHYKALADLLAETGDAAHAVEAYKDYFRYEESYTSFLRNTRDTALLDRLERELLSNSASGATTGDNDASLRSLSLALLNQRRILRRAKREILSEDANDQKLRVTMKAIDSVLDAQVHWNQVEQQLSPDHLAFSKRLLARYPDITRTELHICHLIRLGWSTKAISQLLASSPFTINKHRAHLRTKFKLSREISLQGHLLEI